MKNVEKTSKNNSQKESKYDEFLNNAYKQINKNIFELLS